MQQTFPSPDLSEPFLGGQIDVRQMLLSIYRFKFAILGLALVAGLLAFYYASTLVPVYQARGTLLIEQHDPNIVSIQDVYSTGYRNWEYRETQYQLLQSRSLAERVVRKMGLHKDPKYAPKSSDEQEDGESGLFGLDLSFLMPAEVEEKPEKKQKQLSDEEKEEQLITRLSGMIAGGIGVNPVPDSQLVALTYRSTDPEFAAEVVNTVADQYIESYLDAKLEATLKANQWLSDRLADLRESLRESENRLQAYREQESLVDVEGIATLSTRELSDLNAKYTEAREKRQNLELIKNEVERLRGAPPERLLDVPAIQNHPLIGGLLNDLNKAERNLADLSKRYGVKHPKLIAAKSEVRTTTNLLQEEVKKVIAGITTDYQIARETERNLREQLDESKESVQEINRKEFEIQSLEREVETNRQLYDMFFTRLQETSQTADFQNANARVVDKALVPSSPVSPNKRLIVMAGFVGGFMLGAGVAILLGILDNTVKTPQDVESKLNAKLLGLLPIQKPEKDGYLKLYWEDPQSLFSEHIRTLRTGLVLSGLDNPLKIIVMTSSLPHEGKSIVSLDVAASFAQMEKTLVIGADLRRPTLASKCKFSPRHPGLSNYVAGSATLEECLVKVGTDDLYVMPSGLIPANPLEMLSSGKFREALDVLSERFDRIIIDSAPVQAVSDALILATYADSVVYVVCADSTSASVAKRGIERIRATSVPLAGVILNRFDAEKASKYYGARDYGYDSYYTYESVGEKKA